MQDHAASHHSIAKGRPNAARESLLGRAAEPAPPVGGLWAAPQTQRAVVPTPPSHMGGSDDPRGGPAEPHGRLPRGSAYSANLVDGSADPFLTAPERTGRRTTELLEKPSRERVSSNGRVSAAQVGQILTKLGQTWRNEAENEQVC